MIETSSVEITRARTQCAASPFELSCVISSVRGVPPRVTGGKLLKFVAPLRQLHECLWLTAAQKCRRLPRCLLPSLVPCFLQVSSFDTPLAHFVSLP